MINESNQRAMVDKLKTLAIALSVLATAAFTMADTAVIESQPEPLAGVEQNCTYEISAQTSTAEPIMPCSICCDWMHHCGDMYDYYSY